MWKEVDDEKDRLFDLILQVQEKLSKKRNGGRHMQPIAESDLRQCSWGEVLSEVNTTAEWWKGSPDKENKTMVFIDKIGKYSGGLETWLGLLPMGDYGSRYVGICGVFKLAIGAATQYSSTGELIFQEMGGHSLDRRSFELFRVVLVALSHVMQFFADSKMSRFLTYKNDLQTSVDNVRKQAQAFKEEAQICHARETHENSRILASIKENNETVQKLLLQMLEASPLFRSNRSERLAPEHRSPSPRIAGYDMANVDYMVLVEDAEPSLQLRYLMPQEVRKQIEEKMADEKMEVEVTRSKLYQILKYDEDSVQRDVASCLRYGHRLEERGKSKAAALFQHRDFRSFMIQSEFSICLLVNGRDDLAAVNCISPLSLAMAELTRMSRAAGSEIGHSFVIALFCGEHRPNNSCGSTEAWRSSAVGLIASLIGQLLHQATEKGAKVNLSFMTVSKWRKLRRFEPKVLCMLLKELIKQLPSGTVVLCIVDEAAIYETGGLQSQLIFIMERLLHMVRIFADGPQVFKLLVTSQDRAVAVSQLFGGHILNLPETVDENDSAQYAISRAGL
ncbi:hypothetical protein LZ31DRAFT_612917 [Colletotrichum somersetense]|nr:hypothetical protein LZ31DRAFT_612917 [Colletotrichum somersetense]